MNTTLRHISNASGQVLVALGLAVGAMTAFAPVAKADNVFVNNPEVSILTFTPSHDTSGGAIALTSNTALTSTSVGSVNVKSNSVGGFKVEVASTNLGLLKRSSGESMAYTLAYNGGSAAQITALTQVEDNTAVVTDCSDASGCDRGVTIAIAQSEVVSKPAGDYSDTLTFTLTNH